MKVWCGLTIVLLLCCACGCIEAAVAPLPMVQPAPAMVMPAQSAPASSMVSPLPWVVLPLPGLYEDITLRADGHVEEKHGQDGNQGRHQCTDQSSTNRYYQCAGNYGTNASTLRTCLSANGDLVLQWIWADRYGIWHEGTTYMPRNGQGKPEWLGKYLERHGCVEASGEVRVPTFPSGSSFMSMLLLTQEDL